MARSSAASNPRPTGSTRRRDGETLLRRRAVRLRGRGVITLGIGVLSFILAYAGGRTELLVVAALAILLVVVGVITVRLRRPQFDVIRIFSPPVVAANGLTRVTVRVRNIASTASTPLLWSDAIPWPQRKENHELPAIPTGSANRRSRSIDYELVPPRRGIYPIGPFVVEFEDPFGMAVSVQAIGEADRLIVVPEIVELPTGGPTLADGEGSAQLVQRRVTGNDDDLTTREYRWGDALRRVHWRASARHGELMVRQEEPRSHPDARIVVDTRQGGYSDAVPDPGDTWSPAARSESFEWVVRMTASLGAHLESAGFRVSIEETALPQVEGLGGGRMGGRRSEGFLTSLAGVRLVDRKHDPVGSAVVADAEGPVFALLGNPELETVEWVIRRRRPGQAAIAFLVDAGSGVHKRLSEAGWQVIGVDDDADLGDAWRAAANEAGYVRGSH